MAVTSGKVLNLKVDKPYNFAYFWVKEEDTGISNLFILWDPPYTPYDYLYHPIWLSMLRDAIAHNFKVDIGHDEDSAIVDEVLIAPGSP